MVKEGRAVKSEGSQHETAAIKPQPTQGGFTQGFLSQLPRVARHMARDETEAQRADRDTKSGEETES